MAKLLVCLMLLCAMQQSLGAMVSRISVTRPLFFAFGDSYVDTGNLPRSDAVWRPPFGVTWPGQPSGRFSDGKVQADILASEVLDVPSPLAYAQLSARGLQPLQGVNFAVGGAGAVNSVGGSPSFSTQIQWFTELVRGGNFTPQAINGSVVLVSFSGNDYSAHNPTSSPEETRTYVAEVVRGLEVGIQALTALGPRNFIVTSLAPGDCLPASTRVNNYTSCERVEALDYGVTTHNAVLGSALARVFGPLEDASYVYLNQTEAFRHIVANPARYGFSDDVLKPCCLGECGRPGQFELCEDPTERFFFDNVHPTDAAWKAVFRKYDEDETPIAQSPTSMARRLGPMGSMGRFLVVVIVASLLPFLAP